MFADSRTYQFPVIPPDQLRKPLPAEHQRKVNAFVSELRYMVGTAFIERADEITAIKAEPGDIAGDLARMDVTNAIFDEAFDEVFGRFFGIPTPPCAR